MSKKNRGYSTLSWYQLVCVVALVMLIVVTRPHHFYDIHHLPDASLAAFFLLGFSQAKHHSFLLLTFLCLFTDLTVSYFDQALGECFTPAYPFIVIGYYVLWWFGKTSFFSISHISLKHTLNDCMTTCIALWFATTIAFASSNLSFYYFSGLFSHTHIVEFIDVISRYFWPFQVSAFCMSSLHLVFICKLIL